MLKRNDFKVLQKQIYMISSHLTLRQNHHLKSIWTTSSLQIFNFSVNFELKIYTKSILITIERDRTIRCAERVLCDTSKHDKINIHSFLKR